MTPLMPDNTTVSTTSFEVQSTGTIVRLPKKLFDVVTVTGARDALGFYSLLEGAPSMFKGLGVDEANLLQAIDEAKAELAKVIPAKYLQPTKTPNVSFGAAVPPGATHKLGSKA